MEMWGGAFSMLNFGRPSYLLSTRSTSLRTRISGSGVLDGLGDLLEGGGAVVEELEAPEAEAAVAGLDGRELCEADAEAWAPGGVFVGPDDLANGVDAAFLRDGVKDFKHGGGEVIETTDDFLTHGPRCGFHKWTCQEWLRWLN